MHFKALISFVVLLELFNDINSTTLKEEKNCIKQFKQNAQTQIKKQEAATLFKMASEKIEILKDWDEEYYKGTQTPVYVQEVEKHEFAYPDTDAMHLIFLIRNSISSEIKLEDFEYFFLAVRYSTTDNIMQYHRVGIFRTRIEDAYFDALTYCDKLNKFQFREIWHSRKNAEDARDRPVEKFAREWRVNTDIVWKIVIYESPLGCRFDALVLNGKSPRVKFASKYLTSQAAVEQEVESYLRSPQAATKLENWIYLPQLDRYRKQEFVSLLDNFPQPLHDILKKNIYELQRVSYCGNGTESVVVFLKETGESAEKVFLLVAARKGNSINNKGLVPTNAKELSEDEIDPEIDAWLSSPLPFLSEILEVRLQDLFEGRTVEIYQRVAAREADNFELVSIAEMKTNGMCGIYACCDEDNNVEGYFFVALHYDVGNGKMRVEFVQPELSTSEDNACQEIKKYENARAPTLRFRTWPTKEEFDHFVNIETLFSKTEDKIKQSIATLAEFSDLLLINAAEVDYNGICGIIGVYMFTDPGKQAVARDTLSKKVVESWPIKIKPATSDLISQNHNDDNKGKSAVKEVETVISKNSKFFAVALELDQFSQKWIYRDTLPICQDLEQVEYSAYFYLNGNFPFGPNWIEFEVLKDDENVKSMELIVGNIMEWNTELSKLKSFQETNRLPYECKVWFYKTYIITMHLYGKKRFKHGYFWIASKRNNCAELVYLSPVSDEKALWYRMFQYMKQPFPYLEDWIPVEETILQNSPLSVFKISSNLQVPSKVKGSENNNNKESENQVENILERLENLQFVAVRTISCRHEIQRIGVLESTSKEKTSENIWIAWNETKNGKEIFHWSVTSRSSLDKFLSDYVRYSWKRLDEPKNMYQNLSSNVNSMMKWRHGSAVAKLVTVFELSENEVYALYNCNVDKNSTVIGVLARTIASETSEVPSPLSESQNSPRNSEAMESPKNSEVIHPAKKSTFFSFRRNSTAQDSPDSPRNRQVSDSPRDSKSKSSLNNSGSQITSEAWEAPSKLHKSQNSPPNTETLGSSRRPNILAPLRIFASKDSPKGPDSPRNHENSNSPKDSKSKSSLKISDSRNSSEAPVLPSKLSHSQSSPSNSDAISALQHPLNSSGPQISTKESQISAPLTKPKKKRFFEKKSPPQSSPDASELPEAQNSETTNSQRGFEFPNKNIPLRISFTQRPTKDSDSPRNSKITNDSRNATSESSMVSEVGISQADSNPSKNSSKINFLRISIPSRNSLTLSETNTSPRVSENSNSPRMSDASTSSINSEPKTSPKSPPKGFKSMFKLRVSVDNSESNVKALDTKWTLLFLDNNLNNDNDKNISKSLMFYYRNPQNGCFGEWIDYVEFNQDSIKPMIMHMEPILLNYLFGSNVKSNEQHESEPCKLTPFKIRMQPQLDRLILIYTVMNPAKSKTRSIVSYFYVAIMTKKYDFTPIGGNDYRINYISGTANYVELVKSNAGKYIAYDSAFNLCWNTFLPSENKTTNDLPFETYIRSTVSKFSKLEKIFLSETRIYVGESSSQYYIYQDSSGEDNFACAVIFDENPAVQIQVSQLRTKVVLEREIMDYRSGRSAWKIARTDLKNPVL